MRLSFLSIVLVTALAAAGCTTLLDQTSSIVDQTETVLQSAVGLAESASALRRDRLSPPQVTESYDERYNLDSTAYTIQVEVNPYTFFQVVQSVSRSDGETTNGLFTQASNLSGIATPGFRHLLVYVDGQRFDFYGAPVKTSDVSENRADEYTRYFASRPETGDLQLMQDLGFATVEEMFAQITDPDPVLTDQRIQQLAALMLEANDIRVKIFGDRDPTELEYALSEQDKEVLEDFMGRIAID
ncbi:MAG: hypothetical protein ACOCWS_02870 [Alkalispirochaetaceae bacterium]